MCCMLWSPLQICRNMHRWTQSLSILCICYNPSYCGLDMYQDNQFIFIGMYRSSVFATQRWQQPQQRQHTNSTHGSGLCHKIDPLFLFCRNRFALGYPFLLCFDQFNDLWMDQTWNTFGIFKEYTSNGLANESRIFEKYTYLLLPERWYLSSSSSTLLLFLLSRL